MPIQVHKVFERSQSELMIWDGTESTVELVALAETNGLTVQKEAFHLEKRLREWLIVQLLLRKQAPGRSYSTLANGKPVITGGRFISISHCDHLAGLIISDHNIGMDIQNPNPRIEKIAPKFCHDDELKFIPTENRLIVLTIIWSAKEAVFKFFGERVIFADEIRVRPFNIDDPLIWVDYKGLHGKYEFEIEHLMISNFHILFTSNAIAES